MKDSFKVWSPEEIKDILESEMVCEHKTQGKYLVEDEAGIAHNHLLRQLASLFDIQLTLS